MDSRYAGVKNGVKKGVKIFIKFTEKTPVLQTETLFKRNSGTDGFL